MSNRKSYGENANINFVAQVNGVCPKCSCPILYDKNERKYKGYELAHIYPLNPTDEEKQILKGVELSSEDPNHDSNIIPLCISCHNKLDNPRTLEEYNQLLAIKKKILADAYQQKIFPEYMLENDIIEILDKLAESSDNYEGNIEYDIKILDEKLDSTMPPLMSKKIRWHVTSYYPFIKDKLATLDNIISERISLQIKLFYLEQKKQNIASQDDVYRNLVNWIMKKTRSVNHEASEIIVAFFIQNCEVFK